MSSHFENLPSELAYEIVEHAMASPSNTQMRPDYEANKNACLLALVSTSFRRIIMPRLLRTVILSSHNAVVLFLRTLELQRSFVTTHSRLQLDYKKLIRCFWSSVYNKPIPKAEHIDYHPLYDIIYDIEELGFDWNSIHLLIAVLDLNYTPRKCPINCLPAWKTTRLTLSGHPRWLELFFSFEGYCFLQKITHLTLWGPVTRAYAPWLRTESKHSSNIQVPNWVSFTPLKTMYNLTHLAYTVIDTSTNRRVPIVTYKRYLSDSTTGTQQTETDNDIFHTWITSSKPLAHGSVRLVEDFGIPIPAGADISAEAAEAAFYRGENTHWSQTSGIPIETSDSAED